MVSGVNQRLKYTVLDQTGRKVVFESPVGYE